MLVKVYTKVLHVLVVGKCYTCLIVASVVMVTISQSVNKLPYLAVFG